MRALILALAYVSTVVLANVLTSNLGLVAAGFALLVPAGTYAAGLALGLRDALQDAAGVWWVLAGIAVGTALSYLLGDGRIALASGVAFLLSELLDLAVYTPLRQHGWRRAVVASNIVGSVVDTLLFLWLAGFAVTGQSVGGQLLVKAVWCTAVYLLIREVWLRALPRERQLPESA
jgi:queuosine precursor transporter